MTRRKNSVRRNVMRNHLGDASWALCQALEVARVRGGGRHRSIPEKTEVWAALAMEIVSQAIDALDEADGGGHGF